MPPAATTGRRVLHQPQRAHALVVRGVEHATVAARLHALGHHHVDTGALDVQRLLQRGGAGQGQATGAAQCVDEMRLGQAKVKTHHRRALLQHHALQWAIAHRRGVYVVQALGRLRPKLGKFGCQILQPSGFARAVVLAVVVAKQVDVEGRLRQCPRALDLGLRSFHAQCAQAQRAQPPALAHGSGQFGGRGARHRGLNDGVQHAQALHPGGQMAHTPSFFVCWAQIVPPTLYGVVVPGVLVLARAQRCVGARTAPAACWPSGRSSQ